MANQLPPPPPEEELFSSAKGAVPPPPPEEELYKSPKFYELEKQPGLQEMGKTAPLQLLGESYLKGMANPMPGSMIAAPINAAIEASNKLGPDVARKVAEGGDKITGRIAGLGASLATNPLTYMGAGAAPTVEKAMAGGVSKPGVFTKVLNLFKKPVSEEAIADSADEVGSMINTAKSRMGAMLDEVKGKYVPINVIDKEKSAIQYGNTYGLDVSKPLKPLEKAREYMSPKQTIPKGEEAAYAGLGKEELAPIGRTEPYTIGPHDTKEDLLKEISNFRQKSAEIDPGDRLKAASYLQSKINKYVDWSKEGDDIEGLLKQQHGDLKNIIKNATPELQDAKSKMAAVYNALEGISNKFKNPGETIATLKRLYKNPTGKNADIIAKLKVLEKLTGQETVDELFKKLAAQETIDIAHPISGPTKYALQHIGDVVRKGTRLATGPAAALSQFALSDKNKSVLQSVKDRLKTNESK